MCENEDAPRRRNSRRKLRRLGKRGGQRLLAHDINTGIKKRRRYRLMKLRRSCYHNHIDPIRAVTLAPGHHMEIFVDAVVGDLESRSGSARNLRIDREGAADEIVAAVRLEGDTVRLADDRVEATAYHAEPQTTTERR